METIKQMFIVIQRSDFRSLVDHETTDRRWCPIVKTVIDVNGIIQDTKSEKERNNAITATRFNLPFIIGDHMIIPVATNRHLTIQGAPDFLTIFGGQILDDNVGE